MEKRSSGKRGFSPANWPFYVFAGVVCVLLWSQHSCPNTRTSISLTAKPSLDTAIQPAALIPGEVKNPDQLGSSTFGSPPYSLPKLIHQTVANKSRMSCEHKRAMETWKRLNPGYTHRLWDDTDMKAFMVKHYPDLVPVPYDSLISGTERSDLWRVLVLHKYGGVYADIDVECLKPIDEWNIQHGNDAAVLLGVENYEPNRSPHKYHVTNWVMAAMPGHPLLGLMPAVVTRTIQQQYFALARTKTAPLSPQLYEAGILDRTGPAALTMAMYDFFDSIKFDLNGVAKDVLVGGEGVVAGGARVLPLVLLGSGWEVAEARSKGRQYSCADLAKDKPQALVCHMFHGTWRAQWSFRQKYTYDNC